MKTGVLHAALAAALLCAACSKSASSAEKAPQTDDEKALYTIGYITAARTQQLQLSDKEKEMVRRGMDDALKGKKAAVDPAEQQQNVNRFAMAAQNRPDPAAEKTKAAGKAYAEKAAKEQGAQKFPVKTPQGVESFVVFKELKAGTGPSPKASDQVKVNYEGRLTDGTVFDSSYKRGQPAEFQLSGVIPCWTEGVQHLKVGGKAQLVCPSDIAYGDKGHPPTIPGGSTLVFDVELLGINGK